MTNQRLDRLRQQFAAREIDALIVTKPENRRWLSGFTGSTATLVITEKDAVLLTDFRYTEQATAEAPAFTLREHKGAKVAPLVAEILQAAGATRLGFEGDFVGFDAYQLLAEGLDGFHLVSVSGLVEKLRRIKDEQELAVMRRAAAITDAGFHHILKYIQVGMREIDVALELEFFMRKQGAEGLAFDTIAASGWRSSLPHGRASEKVIAVGDFVTFDFGSKLDGYCSDFTRTVVMGEPTDQQREIYDIVLEAQIAGLAACKAGITGKELDAACRDIIAGKGYGDKFGHSTGHSVGLFIHEGPSASALSDEVLEPGMMMTIEPGIYIPGWGGVRIEDLVLVTADGCELFSHAPKELIILD